MIAAAMSVLQPIFPVLAHNYGSKLVPHACIYELTPPEVFSRPSRQSAKLSNALVFIGGLGDGPHTVPAIRAVAQRLAEELEDWSVFEIRLNSSFGQWGFSSLKEDVREIGEIVSYLKEKLAKVRVVLMGHSTGCQDCMEYVVKSKNELPHVDGIILQGPVSDREGLKPLMEKDGRNFQESLTYATRLVEEGNGGDYMPKSQLPLGYDNPITAYRWHSLISVGGDDDYFSSDLPDDKVAEIWKEIGSKILIVPSGKDEHVPDHIDVAGLVRKWISACRPGIASELSGLIPGANHRVEQAGAQQWLAERVVGFLKEVVAKEGKHDRFD
ncbi:DUF1749-domain-containing protein [Coniochaeta sp. PMI_546]|nr:DUF1749-domain-containing protein [Coniochaeta sp. PMI_546]